MERKGKVQADNMKMLCIIIFIFVNAKNCVNSNGVPQKRRPNTAVSPTNLARFIWELERAKRSESKEVLAL